MFSLSSFNEHGNILVSFTFTPNFTFSLVFTKVQLKETIHSKIKIQSLK